MAALRIVGILALALSLVLVALRANRGYFPALINADDERFLNHRGVWSTGLHIAQTDVFPVYG